MSTILDMITGGGLLPHVYCRKVTLERSKDDTGLTDVTLQLELYQDKNALSKSNWLNSLNVQGQALMDALYIQPVALGQPSIRSYGSYTPAALSSIHVKKLLASNHPTKNPNMGPGSSNVYVAKRFLGDGFLPRGSDNPFLSSTLGSGIFPGGVDNVDNPIQVSAGSLLGDISKVDAIPALESEGKIREEMKNGKPYLVIPFEYKFRGFDEKAEAADLGFLFYTFLDFRVFLSGIEVNGTDLGDAFLNVLTDEAYVVEGPVNTVVVFQNGEMKQTREVFTTPDGMAWEGSVHIHTEDNISPDGYFGDGSFGDNKGWMVGEEHKLGVNQPRLSLIEVPNNLISDFRSGISPEPADGALGLGSKTQVFNLGTDVSLAERFLSPFQKEKKKDLVRDNDTEFSKLYVSRDRDNNARGMFFINTLELLRNNSDLFPVLFGQEMVNGFLTNIAEFSYGEENFFAIYNILQKSKILELRLYRDRVKKHVINTRYEKYSNDEDYEEPSQLIGTISDQEGFQTPSQSVELSEVTDINSPQAGQTKLATRYFMFTDKQVGEMSAGLYRYRLELEFKDGTYEYLYNLYQDMSRSKVKLDHYYDIAVSNFVRVISQPAANFDTTLANSKTSKPDTYQKSILKKYYQNGAFVAEFDTKVKSEFPSIEGLPWERPLLLLERIQKLFDIFPVISAEKNKKLEFTGPGGAGFKNMLRPTTGSPQGINYIARLMDTAMKKLASLLDATKTSKSGNELSNSSKPNGYTYNNMFEIVVSPSDSIIREYYTFDHPSELFKGLSNEDIYIDYLSIGEAADSDFEGLRSYSPGYYSDRCRLDAVKLSPRAIGNGFENYNFGFGANVLGAPADTFDATGYSFLMPSVVELSDPSKENNAYGYFYTAFQPGARAHLSQPETVPLYSEGFQDTSNYQSLLIALLNYSLNKSDTDYADLTGVTGIPSWLNDPSLHSTYEVREAYKRLFDNYSITVHSSNLYGKFFDRLPGAVSEDLDDKTIEYRNGSGLLPSDFSDGLLRSQDFFNDLLLSDKQGIIKSPSGNPSPYVYTTNLPNSFKFRTVRFTKNISDNEDIAQPVFATALDSIPSDTSQGLGDYGPFFFFQTSLTARIEVFRGASFPKDDEDSWSLLTEADLNLSGQQKLFCRIKTYDENLLNGIELPILDKYFLIYNDGDDPFLPPAIPPSFSFEDDETALAADFWDNQSTMGMNMAAQTFNEATPAAIFSPLPSGGPQVPSGPTPSPTTSSPSTVSTPTASPVIVSTPVSTGGGGGYSGGGGSGY